MVSGVDAVLAKLAGVRANIQAALGGDLSNGGWGLDRTLGYLDRFSGYVEQLRTLDPVLFGDLPRRHWSISIASQKDALRQAERDLREIFARSTHAGLWHPQGQPENPAPPRNASGRSWFVDHLWQIVVGLVVGYLLFQFGWNR